MPKPDEPSWWYEKIRHDAMSWRARQFPYQGREVAALAYVLVLVTFGWFYVLQPLGGVGDRFVSYLLTVLGVSISGLFAFSRRLDDPYHTKFHATATNVIDDVSAKNPSELKRIAMEHLEGVEKSEADRELCSCAQELASAYRP